MKMFIEFTCRSFVIFDLPATNCMTIGPVCALFLVLGILFEYLLTMNRIKSQDIEKLNRTDIEYNYSDLLGAKLKMTVFHVGICVFIYLTMFALMTYNAFIIISIILGNVIGYYIFGFNKEIKVRPIAQIGCCHAE